MTPSWMTQVLAEERQRDLMEHQRAHRLVREALNAERRTRGARRGAFGLREWLGWRLVDLGVHLVVRPVAARSVLVPFRD